MTPAKAGIYKTNTLLKEAKNVEEHYQHQFLSILTATILPVSLIKCFLKGWIVVLERSSMVTMLHDITQHFKKVKQF